MRYYLTLLVFLLSLFILNSCNEKTTIKNSLKLETDTIVSPFEEENTSPYTATIFSTNTQEEKVSIYIDYYLDTLFTLYAIKETKDGATIKEVLLEQEWSEIHVEKPSLQTVTIDNKEYIYLAYRYKFRGAAIPDSYVHFEMIDISDLSSYVLQYHGKETIKCESCIDGEFVENSYMKNNFPQIKTKLFELSKTSDLIYQPSKEEADPYHYMNFEKKWNKDNNADYTYGYGYTDIKTPIYSTYYNTNLFEMYSTQRDYIENDRYILTSYFRNNIIGYDKERELYFPLLVESCADGCNKEIEFLENDSLIIIYESEILIHTISMDDIIFDEQVGN